MRESLTNGASKLAGHRFWLTAIVALLMVAITSFAPTKAEASVLGWCTVAGAGQTLCFPTPSQACVEQHQVYAPAAPFFGYEDFGNSWSTKLCMWQTGSGIISPTIVSFECSDSVHEIAYPPSACITDNYQCQVCSNTGTAGQNVATTPNPINILTGNKSFSAADYQTVGGSLLLRRAFASIPFSGLQSTLVSQPLGLGNWFFDFQYELQIGRDWVPAAGRAYVVLTTPNGPAYTFQRQSDGSMLAYTASEAHPVPQTDYTLAFVGAWPSNLATLTNSSTSWTVHDSRNDVWTLTTMANPSSSPTVYNIARPTQMVEPNGLTWTFTYGTSAELLSMTDSYGKTITFTWQYDTNSQTGKSYPRAIVQASLPGGYTLKYGYAGIGGTSEADVLASVQLYDPSNNLVDQTTYQQNNTSFPYSVTNVINADGVNQWAVTYDSNGRATQSQGADSAYGYSVSYGTSGSTFTNTVTNPLGKQANYNYQTSPKFGLASINGLASAHTPASTQSFTYGSDGFIDQTSDENGNVTKYTRNSRGLPTQIVEAFGTTVQRTTNITWDPVNYVPTEIAAPNLTTDFQYGSGGNLLKVTKTDTTTNSVPYSTNGQQRVWQYTWSATGQLTSVEGPLGATDTTTYGYDPTTGYLASVTNPLNQTATISFRDYRGDPTQVTDSNGILTNLAYDGLGRLTSIARDPGGLNAVTNISYDAVGDITQLTQPNGSYLKYNYDTARRVTSIVDNLGNSRVFTYNAMGESLTSNVVSSASAIVQEQSLAYDELGRLLKLINAETNTTVFGYDLNSNLTSVTDPLSNAHAFAFDALNRLMSDTDPNHFVTQISHDVQDNVASVTDARSLTTSYVRDGFGEVTQQTSPDTGTSVFWYDAEGRLAKRVDADGHETDFAHDLLGRLTSKTFPADTGENVTQTYDSTSGGNDGVGQLTSVSDQSGSANFTYNSLGQLVTDAHTISGQSYTVSYSYDGAGKVISMTYPSGRAVNFSRDANGQVAGITTTGGATIVTDVTYKPFNGPNAFTFGNGIGLTTGYNLDGGVSSITAANGTSSIQNLSFGYDANENIASISDSVNSGRSQTFGYDPLYRLNAATGTYGTQAYTYDGVGNRITGSASGTSYSYASSANQLSTVTSGANTRTFTYDPAGMMLTDARAPGTAYTYTYNQDNRLITSSLNGTTVGAYVYNAFGQRAAKTASGAITHFVYDASGRLIMEANGSTGAVQREYVWLNDTPVAMVDETGASPVIYYIHSDQLGTPQKLTDGSANIVWDGVFDPFGNEVMNPGALTMQLRFPGQYADAETELNQNWFRDYDSTIGRYVESDPIGLNGGLNTYVYASENPAVEKDQTGKDIGGFIDPELAPLLEPLLRAPFRFPVPGPTLSPRPGCDWQQCLADFERLSNWCQSMFPNPRSRQRQACDALAGDNLSRCKRGEPPKDWPFDWVEPPIWYPGPFYEMASVE